MSVAATAGAVALAGVLLAGLHLLLRRRTQWLVASLLIALAYILFSAAPGAGILPAWEPAVRWGLFLATILGLVRFRFWDRWPAGAGSKRSSLERAPDREKSGDHENQGNA